MKSTETKSHYPTKCVNCGTFYVSLFIADAKTDMVSSMQALIICLIQSWQIAIYYNKTNFWLKGNLLFEQMQL